MERSTAPRLVGRAAELQTLDYAVASAASGHGSTVLVAGEAGIGKTRLTLELADRARRSGATVLTGRCIDLVGGGLPYLPLVEALRPLRGEPALEELRGGLRALTRLIPELGEPDRAEPTDASTGDLQMRMFEETLVVLDRIGAEGPVVLVLEDLHWADASTLGIVAFLAHAVGDRSILVVATYRSDERGDALGRLVTEFLRSREAVVLELAPLGHNELARLLAEAAEEPLPPELVAAICARSEGNPFFAEELAAAVGRGEEALPGVLRDVLLQRVEQLGAETRSVLRIAAASGRDVPYRLLAAVAPLTEPELAEALREAVEHRVLTPDTEVRSFRFRHTLLAEAIYTTVLPGEREDLHERLAVALADDPVFAASSISGELAEHWYAAGRPQEALEASVAAARDAEAVSGLTEALRHLERVLELWSQVEDPESLVGLDLAGVLCWAAEAAYFAGGGRRAAELVEQAISIRSGAGADDTELGVLHERLGTYLLPVGDRRAALAAYERAVALVPEQPPAPARVSVLGAYANALSLGCRFDESRSVCEEALAVAAVIGDVRAALRARAVLGLVLCHLGHGALGVSCLLETREQAREHGTASDELRTYVLLSDVLLLQGRLNEAARDALEGLAAARRHGYERSSGIVLAANAAEALLGLGDWAGAEDVLANALRAAAGFRPEAVHIRCAQLAVGRGDVAAARQHLELGAAAASEPQSRVAYAAIEAELALWEGRAEDAQAVVGEALQRDSDPSDLETLEPLLCALGLRAEAELARHAAVRRDGSGTGAARERADRLLERTRRSAATAARIAPDAAGWLVLAEAEQSRVDGRPSPEAWQAAVAAWDDLGRPYLAAYGRWRLAEAMLASGALRTEAAAPAREGMRVAERIGARPLARELELLAARGRLDLIGAGAHEPPGPGNELGLTAREREVLQLLARGYTNREIASELTISVKTASVHVSHILRKLGVATRLEAAEIAHRIAPRP